MKRCHHSLWILLSLASAGLSCAYAKEPGELPLIFEESFARGIDRWEPTDPSAWRMVKTDKGNVYSQYKTNSYKPPHRSPLNISLVKGLSLTDFVLQTRH